MEIDIKKEYETVSGRKVRIYATDGCGEQPIHGAMLGDSGWESERWSKDGIYNHNTLSTGILNLKEKK